MGMPGPFSRSCCTNTQAPAPNPSPERWEMLEKTVFENSYALKVRYFDATNFEGIKVMVFRGKYIHRDYLDPHFENTISAPVARFRPDYEGWNFAVEMAKMLSR